MFYLKLSVVKNLGSEKMEKCRFSVQIDKSQRDMIHERIKAEYPRVKTVSELVRAALQEYLARRSH